MLATIAASIVTDKVDVSTYHINVLCSQHRYAYDLVTCTHEKLNSRILPHMEYDMKRKKRAASQASHCRAKTMMATSELLYPSEWGLEQE